MRSLCLASYCSILRGVRVALGSKNLITQTWMRRQSTACDGLHRYVCETLSIRLTTQPCPDTNWLEKDTSRAKRYHRPSNDPDRIGQPRYVARFALPPTASDCGHGLQEPGTGPALVSQGLPPAGTTIQFVAKLYPIHSPSFLAQPTLPNRSRQGAQNDHVPRRCVPEHQQQKCTGCQHKVGLGQDGADPYRGSCAISGTTTPGPSQVPRGATPRKARQIATS